MNHLLRGHAPIGSEAWAEIDGEARERLPPLLTARRLVDWAGSGGWKRSATALGRTEDLDGPPGVRQAAEVENRAVFHGWPAAGIEGIVGVGPHPPLALGEDAGDYPSVVAGAVDTLRQGGVDGPYALAIGPAGYTRIVETTEQGGYPLVEHLGRILDGPVMWTPGLDGAVVLSQRGGNFLLEMGQDLAIGYLHHDADTVSLYLEQSFSFRVVEDDAAVTLKG